MRIRMICFACFIAAALLLAAIPSRAQARFEIDPFVGYETTASYPVYSLTGPSSGDPIDRLRVNGSTAFGTFLDYSLTEHFQPEFMWNRNNTSYSAHDLFMNTYIDGYHSVIDQYQFGGLYMFRSSDVSLRPYVAASLGFTHDENGDSTPNRTEFSYSVGGGLKYYMTRHLGLRADLRYLPTYGNSSNELYCYYGCYYANVAHFLNRGSFTGGIIFKF